MFRFTSGEWDELENGFNFWRLSDKYSFGLKVVWGDAEEGKHMITLRYSKVTKKFDFRKNAIMFQKRARGILCFRPYGYSYRTN